MTGKLLGRSAVVVAVASLGFAALTGCTTGTASPGHTVLTTKSAAEYYEKSSCSLNATEYAFNVAVLNAEQSTESTGPDLDSLKAAALGYQKASRAAAVELGSSKIVWPASVRKSITVLATELRALVSPLGEMAAATQMTDERAGFKDLPDNTGADAAATAIRSKLGLPSDTSSSCPETIPVAITVAPASGILIKGTGYSFHAPSGWTPPPRAVDADAYAVSAKTDANGIYDTVNVLLGTPNSDTLDEQEQNGAAFLEEVKGSTQVRIMPRVLIAGEVGIHVSSLAHLHGVTQWSEQYAVEHDGTGFTITFAFNKSEPQATRDAVEESVLASWKWS